MKQDILLIVKRFVIPAVYAVIVRLFLGGEEWDDLFDVMTVSFLFGLPINVGALTIYLYKE